MVSVKGPRSALTDFIEEHGIKIEKQTQKENKPVTQERKKKIIQKKVKRSKPYELSSKDLYEKLLQNIILSRIINNLDKYKLNDDHLKMISSYLSIQRKFNLDYFNFISDKVYEKLVIYDCSMIKDEEFNISSTKLKVLELHQCGQISNLKLNEILGKQTELEELRITGGYLLTEINLPSKLKILDLGNCNRICNSVILEINKKYKKLDELVLSYCYKITDEFKLKSNVKRLFLDETRVSENFFKIKDIQNLSFKNCVNINELRNNYKNLEYLDLENITTIENLSVSDKIKHLNIQRCYNLTPWFKENINNLINLEYLNISYLEFEDFDFLYSLRNLKEVDLSWCANVTDELIIKLIGKTSLERITVFGCFNLTSKCAKISYEYKNRVTIVGNHAETKFLIQNH